MSHAACNYVKRLKVAPNGEKISAAERAVLWYLADEHLDSTVDNGFQPGPLLAEHAGISHEEVYGLVEGLERKGIFRRTSYQEEMGGKSVNIVEFHFADVPYGGSWSQ